ncbi:MAG: enoyl-CoA hydratase/isomerase family protein [SAR324 cluster bacterium]|nr:enoyl-CoA hydratase/isomerase family protein [SAR324 cluster bacterium]
MKIASKIENKVGHLYFEAFNGAMDLDHLVNLQAAFFELQTSALVKVIVLWGGEEFFSNGIDLVSIEQGYNPAVMAYRNLKALNKLITSILTCSDKLLIAAFRGPAAAGGVMLGLACDLRYGQSGIVLNPNYVNMDLCGSEYWSLLLPTIVGLAHAQRLLLEATPISLNEAVSLGIIHEDIEADLFEEEITKRAEFLANQQFAARLATKNLLLASLREKMKDFEARELKAMKEICNSEDFATSRNDFINKKPKPSFVQIASKNLHRPSQ